MPSLQVFLDYFGTLGRRRLRWKTHIRRQVAYNTIISEILAGDPLTVIAYGGGKFSHASRGHAPTPNVHLYKQMTYRRLRVRMTTEHRTSKLCSRCHSDTRQGKYWWVKVCLNADCRVFWNRDVNAARNIRDIFVFQDAHNGALMFPFGNDPANV